MGLLTEETVDSEQELESTLVGGDRVEIVDEVGEGLREEDEVDAVEECSKYEVIFHDEPSVLFIRLRTRLESSALRNRTADEPCLAVNSRTYVVNASRFPYSVVYERSSLCMGRREEGKLAR